jgi:hypothetical protein
MKKTKRRLGGRKRRTLLPSWSIENQGASDWRGETLGSKAAYGSVLNT